MKIITAHFDYPGNTEYSRCLKALKNSVAENMPDAEFIALELPTPESINGIKQGWISNHKKLEAYSKIEITEPTAFIDTDTLVLKDFSELFTEEFDIAIGRRPKTARVPYNGGVVFFNPTDEARFFMQKWIETDERMLNDREFHQKWRARYNGMNQASFGYLMDTARHLVHLKEYPTAQINACEQDWEWISSENYPYIVHVRKSLFDAAHSKTPVEKLNKRFRYPAKLWREYEQK